MRNCFILISLFFAACGATPKSHRITTTSNFNLKGNIISVIENHVGIISLENHNPDPYAINTINRTEYYFTDNKLGKLCTSIKPNAEQDYLLEYTHFNIDNLESDLYSERSIDDEIISKTYIVYDKRDSMLIAPINGDNGGSSLYYYNNNGVLIKHETKSTEINIYDAFVYNKNNDIESVERIVNYKGENADKQTITYQYIEFDDKKNWIKRICYSGYHFFTMETRTISYKE